MTDQLTAVRPVHALPGSLLLDPRVSDPSLVAHRAAYGQLPLLDLPAARAMLERIGLTGRGGAGFPFGRKLATAADNRGRPTVVVNLSEGEPASHKDAALAVHRPHLVLDGAVLAARCLRAREIHVVVGRENLSVLTAVRRALAERNDTKISWVADLAEPGFVTGQAQAVLELLAGRRNLPVTAWQPEAVRGYRSRPTLLSNAETYAHFAAVAQRGVSAYLAHGTVDEPGTVLLTVHHRDRTVILETDFGTPWRSVLDDAELAGAVLLGGYHGTWVAPGALTGLTVSRTGLAAQGLTLGAGVTLPVTGCPVAAATSIATYLASQSAGRCGPCRNGLPTLATSLAAVERGHGDVRELERLCGLVERRGACAHPDGTSRMVRSLLVAFPDEVARHRAGHCGHQHEGVRC